jgi:hypothetical protein
MILFEWCVGRQFFSACEYNYWGKKTYCTVNLHKACEESMPYANFFYLARSLAIRSSLESGLPRSYSGFGNPRHFTAELSNWPNSSTRHFTSTAPLFDTSYIFDARLSRCKTDTRRIVLGLNYPPMVSAARPSRDTIPLRQDQTLFSTFRIQSTPDFS